jgi:hypothetical protein
MNNLLLFPPSFSAWKKIVSIFVVQNGFMRATTLLLVNSFSSKSERYDQAAVKIGKLANGNIIFVFVRSSNKLLFQ